MGTEKAPNKNESVSSSMKISRAGLLRAVGITCGLLGGFFLNISDGCIKYAYSKYPQHALPPLEMVFVRSAFQVVIIVPLMVIDKTKLYNERSDLYRQIPLGMLHWVTALLVYVTLKYLSVGTTIIIQSTTAVFSSLFDFLLMRDRCGAFNSVCGLLSLLGICGIVAPDLLTPNESQLRAVSSVEHTSNRAVYMNNYLTGVGLCIASVVALSFYFAYSRKNIKKDMDYKLGIFYTATFTVTINPLFMLIMRTKLVLGDLPQFGWMILLFSCAANFLSFFLTVFALKYETAGIVTLTLSTQVIWAYLYDVIIAGIYPNYYSIIGIVVVLVFTVLISLNRIVDFENRLPCNSCHNINNLDGYEYDAVETLAKEEEAEK